MVKRKLQHQAIMYDDHYFSPVSKAITAPLIIIKFTSARRYASCPINVSQHYVYNYICTFTIAYKVAIQLSLYSLVFLYKILLYPGAVSRTTSC